MNLSLTKYIVAMLAVVLIGLFWFFVGNSEQDALQVAIQTEACDSCTVRHSNLTRLRDARDLSAISDE